MSSLSLALSAGCILQIAETTLTPTPEGWVSETHLELAADPACATIGFEMPARASWSSRRVKARWGDGGGRRLAEERWERGTPALDGTRRDTLHLPDLVGGDRVRIDVERSLGPGPVRWAMGAARYAQLETTGAATLKVEAGADFVERHEEDARVWAVQPPRGWEAVATSPSHEPQPIEHLPPATVDERSRSLTLRIPGGDPQLRLHPGGGSAVEVELDVAFAPSEGETAWIVPAPPGASVSFSAEPERIATLEDLGSVSRVRVAPFEGRARVRVGWTEPDAPTFGEKQPHEASVQVTAPGGQIRWNGTAWYLQSFGGRPILPDRSRLVRALDHRFGDRSLPEPSVPGKLRGREPNLTLAADLLEELRQTVGIGAWPADPLWPRRLRAALKDGAVTPMEATLIYVLWARQLGLQARWDLARPASGEVPEVAPSGFRHPLVRVEHGGEVRWLDVACDDCAPFTLPAELRGASLLGG